jgi:hypothetical protein
MARCYATVCIIPRKHDDPNAEAQDYKVGDVLQLYREPGKASPGIYASKRWVEVELPFSYEQAKFLLDTEQIEQAGVGITVRRRRLNHLDLDALDVTDKATVLTQTQVVEQVKFTKPEKVWPACKRKGLYIAPVVL